MSTTPVSPPPPPPYRQVEQQEAASPNPGQQGPSGASNGMALSSLITGIGAVVLCGLGVILGPVAVILGVSARRRPGGAGMARAGIITGAVGTVLSVVAVVTAIWAFSARVEEDHARQSRDEVVVTDEPEEVVVTEEPEDDNPYDDAADAGWGSYAGGIQETPCYSFEGATGWLVNTSAENIAGCQMEYELWADYGYDEDGEVEIYSIGVGGVVAKVDVQSLSDASVDQRFPARDNESMRSDIVNFFTENSYSVVGITDATIGGLPATRFEIDSPTSDTYVAYGVFTPTTYTQPQSGASSFFLITIVSSNPDLWDGQELEQRIVDTFTWK